MRVNAISILHYQFSILIGRKAKINALSILNFQLSIFNFNWAQPFKQKVIGEWKCSWLSLQGDNTKKQRPRSLDKRILNFQLSIFNLKSIFCQRINHYQFTINNFSLSILNSQFNAYILSPPLTIINSPLTINFNSHFIRPQSLDKPILNSQLSILNSTRTFCPRH